VLKYLFEYEDEDEHEDEDEISSATPMTNTIDLEQLTNALYLGSPALPIGSYSYSQGLEAAIETQIISGEAGVAEWIVDGLKEIIGPGEAAALAWQHRHWTEGDFDGVQRLNAWFLASRETAELRLETEQMGWSLTRIALALGWRDKLSQNALSGLSAVAFPTAFAFAGVANKLSISTTLAAFCFSWTENQINAALKAVPLGQESGQRLLQRVRPEIAGVVEKALCVGKEEIVTFAPMLAILSSRHENQPFRIFRS
jgi:urease accessory protein